MDDIWITIILTSISIIIGIFAVYYAKKSFESSKEPKLIIETMFNNDLIIRNVGNDFAEEIEEKSYFKDKPTKLINFIGPLNISDISNNNSNFLYSLSFFDDKLPKPNDIIEVIFFYKNSENKKFKSKIIIERDKYESQIYYKKPTLKEWKKY